MHKLMALNVFSLGCYFLLNKESHLISTFPKPSFPKFGVNVLENLSYMNKSICDKSIYDIYIYKTKGYIWHMKKGYMTKWMNVIYIHDKRKLGLYMESC